MASLRDIRQRIQGVKKTQQITRAMKMVAAAKLRRAQTKIISARPFAEAISGMLRQLIGEVDQSLNPLLKPREINTVGIVVVTSDRGLCGGFNSNLIKAAVKYIEEEYGDYYREERLKVICIGKKGYDYFRRRNYKVMRNYVGTFQRLRYHEVLEIVSALKEDFLSGELDRIDIVYNQFKTIVQPKIRVERFLPIPAITDSDVKDEGRYTEQVDYIYEPSVAKIVSELIPKHLDTRVWRTLLDSNAAEEGSRMVAMDNATENAKEMIYLLELGYNKARQATITREITEIVGGAGALESME